MYQALRKTLGDTMKSNAMTLWYRNFCFFLWDTDNIHINKVQTAISVVNEIMFFDTE